MIPAADHFLGWIENIESVQDLGEVLTQNPDDDLEGFLRKVIDARLIGFNNDHDIFDFARVEEVVFADHKQSLHGVEEGVCVEQIEVEQMQIYNDDWSVLVVLATDIDEPLF